MKENIPWYRLDKVDSTNNFAKEKRKEGKDCIITAKSQTKGRGTKGRSFSSHEGGLYFSKLRFYQDFPAKDAFKVMMNAAVAVCKVLCFYGIQPKIKWPNDIHVGGKKICGILIENSFLGHTMSSSIVGIGLNVCNPLPQELSEIATSVFLECGKTILVDEAAEKLASALEGEYSIEEYRKYLGYMGEKAVVILGEQEVNATLLAVEEDGRLTVEIEGERKKLSSGEVTLKI